MKARPGPCLHILALDSAAGACSAGIFLGAACLASRTELMDRGQAARLPPLTAELLAEAGNPPIGLVAVTVGPGSFTGIRAALGFAHGLAAGWGCPLIGVGAAEALAEEHPGPAWIALHSRAGRIFLAHDAIIGSYALDGLPNPTNHPALLGNGAAAIAALMPGAFHLHGAANPRPQHIAAIALRRHHGELPPLAAQPLYIDPPEARPAA